MQFPEIEGRRSTLATGQAVLGDAARGVDPAVARDIADERNWRRGYLAHLRRLEATAARSPQAALRVAEDGLTALHRRFTFVRHGQAEPLATALTTPGTDPQPVLAEATVRGRGRHPGQLAVPYRGQVLRAGALHRQLDTWVGVGTIEPSCAHALHLVADNPDWLDLADTSIALLGAGSELGPLAPLSSWGANLWAVDLPRLDLWGRILAATGRGCGVLRLPIEAHRAGTAGDNLPAAAGVDLIIQAPLVRRWLDRAAASQPGPLVLGNYAYADGGRHVQVAMAVDAILADLIASRYDVALAFLPTPTDVFAVPADVVADARARYQQRRRTTTLPAVAHRASAGRLYAPNYPHTIRGDDQRELGLADCLVRQQGPNYALAKRLQRWRATSARAAGVPVCANIAPPTRTRSVLRNRLLARAYDGAARFGVEVFEPATSTTLMAALLVHDLRNPAALARPKNPLAHPLDLFVQGANTGGLWRSPYQPRSVLGLAVLSGGVHRDYRRPAAGS